MVALALGEPGGEEYARRVPRFDSVVSSNLLEAEVHSAMARDHVPPGRDPAGGISWVLPRRTLGPEIAQVLAAGYLRGADLWHVACALYASEGRASASTFLTLDARQRAVAAKLGFAT